MYTVTVFPIPDAPECTVDLPLGVSLLDASVHNGDIMIHYTDPDGFGNDTQELTFYVINEGQNVADNFPGKFFKRVEVDDADKYIFFKQGKTKREPIVAKLPGAE